MEPSSIGGSFSSSSHSSAFSITTISLVFSRISRSLPNSWSALRMISSETCQRDVDDSQLPLVLVHMACRTRRQVKACGDECEQNTDLLVVVDRNVEQLLQRPDVLELV
jgi:hypothetical protein